jgi:Zn-dependent protease
MNLGGLTEGAEAAAGVIVGIIGGIAIILVLVAASVFVHFLRRRVWAPKFERLEILAALTQEQEAAAAELSALGFEQTGAAAMQTGGAAHFVLSFQHASSSAFAALVLTRDARVGFPAVFYSFDADGLLLATVNRQIALVPVKTEGADVIDCYAPDLPSHWRSHLGRLAKASPVTISGEEAQQRAFATAEGYAGFLQNAGYIADKDGAWRPGWRMALRQTKERLRNLRSFAKPYVSAVTSGKYRDSHDAACFAEMEAKEANASRSAKAKGWILGLSAATSFPLWGLVLGWDLAVPIMIILAVHEAGHALAMWSFGYRNITVMFVPLLGALVTAKPKDIAVWKQALMLLVGPVPGFAAGAAALLYLKGHPVHAWGLQWTKIAALAAAINFLNLLPITPLDGGKLLEIALFNRWPRARLVFIAVSCLVLLFYSYLSENFILIVFSGALIGSLFAQRRITALQRAWRAGLSREEQIKHLFHVARASFVNPAFATIQPLVKAVFTLRSIRQPRIWESAVFISALLILWSGAAAGWHMLRRNPGTSIVSSGTLTTHSSAITPCRNEQNLAAAVKVCLALLKNGQLDEASQVMAYDKLSEVALIGRDYKTSLEWSRKAIAANPGFAYHHYLAAEALTGLGQFSDAIAMYTGAVKAYPAFFQALHKRGEAYLKLGDIVNAKKDFEAALSVNKDYQPAKQSLMRLK